MTEEVRRGKPRRAPQYRRGHPARTPWPSAHGAARFSRDLRSVRGGRSAGRGYSRSRSPPGSYRPPGHLRKPTASPSERSGRARLPAVPAPIEHTWEQISARLRREVPSGVFDLWLAELEPCDLTGERLVLTGADHKARWVADRFGPALRRGAAAVLGP